MDLIQRVNEHFIESIAAKQQAMEVLSPGIAVAAEKMVACLMNEGKVLACGNGGSAADAQHFAAEMVGRFEKERPGLARAWVSRISTLAFSSSRSLSFNARWES